MEIETYADVVAEIARAGVRHQDVAERLGLTASAFSHIIRDRQGRPSRERVSLIMDALVAITADK